MHPIGDGRCQQVTDSRAAMPGIRVRIRYPMTNIEKGEEACLVTACTAPAAECSPTTFRALDPCANPESGKLKPRQTAREAQHLAPQRWRSRSRPWRWSFHARSSASAWDRSARATPPSLVTDRDRYGAGGYVSRGSPQPSEARGLHAPPSAIAVVPWVGSLPRPEHCRYRTSQPPY
jgi:hypothetical protein